MSQQESLENKKQGNLSAASLNGEYYIYDGVHYVYAGHSYVKHGSSSDLPESYWKIDGTLVRGGRKC